MFGLDDESTLEKNQNLFYLGYQSTYFILNMGNIFLFIVLQFLVILFIFITQKCENKSVKGVQT